VRTFNSLKAAAAQGSHCKALTSIDEAIADKSVKGVVICTPTATHRDLIIASVRAGKAVMCEKPISLDVKELDEFYHEAKKHGVHLFCGTQPEGLCDVSRLSKTK
jgi:myo-inositol 2-dehydrogenase/D-chiro-inositol 1-dehydrogenase